MTGRCRLAPNTPNQRSRYPFATITAHFARIRRIWSFGHLKAIFARKKQQVHHFCVGRERLTTTYRGVSLLFVNTIPAKRTLYRYWGMDARPGPSFPLRLCHQRSRIFGWETQLVCMFGGFLGRDEKRVERESCLRPCEELKPVIMTASYCRCRFVFE